MKKQSNYRLLYKLAAFCLLGAPAAHAQFFNFTGSGDTFAGFRKTGMYQGNYEVVVNLGNISNFLALSIGSQTNIPVPSASQLADAYPEGVQDIQWSVFSAFTGISPLTNSLGVFPGATIWYTLPRTNLNSPTTPQTRFASSSQNAVKPYLLGIGNDAVNISTGLGTTNADNNTSLVREPVSGNGSTDLTAGIGDPGNSTIGDFAGTLPFNVENLNPNTFTTASRSDFYQSVPSSIIGGRGAVTNIDPITGQTNGNAYFVGYFTFNTNGTMTFTRASTAAPAPSLKIALSGITNIISFGASNGVTYNLIYTNLAGITAPRSNWFQLGSSIVGAGNNTNFTDTNSGGAGRVYSVTAH